MSLPTSADVLGIYQAELARLAGEPDAAKRLHYAWQGTRTLVHERLQADAPIPGGKAKEDPDDVHHRQKTHGKSLWKQSDKIVADAGVTPEGGPAS